MEAFLTWLTSEKVLVYIFLTGCVGGFAALLTGRSIAMTWRPFWQALAYMVLLACAVRFLHFALLARNY